MSEHLSDKEQVELIKRWWNDYGRSIAIAVVIGLGVGFGWRYWRSYQLESAEHASALYQSMITADADGDYTVAQQSAKNLLKKFPKTSYATFAALFTAKEAVVAGNYLLAQQNLTWAVDYAKDKRFRQIARIRSARVLLSQKKYDQALKTLKKIDDKTFLPAIAKVKGDVFSSMGRHLEAKREYDVARRGLKNLNINDPILAMKLAN